MTPAGLGSDVTPQDIMFSFFTVCEQACMLKGECVCVNGVLWKYFIINYSCTVCMCVNYVCFTKQKYNDVRKMLYNMKYKICILLYYVDMFDYG